jgi:hypothetical protein
MTGAPELQWPSTLDIPGITDGGWRPIPFREFVVKVHSRCDLACDYCYMYEMADQSWRDRSRTMSIEIARHTATRIGEHTRVQIDFLLPHGTWATPPPGRLPGSADTPYAGWLIRETVQAAIDKRRGERAPG